MGFRSGGVWILSFACLGLMTLSLLRPWPTVSLPDGRPVVDARGVSVPVPDNALVATYVRAFLAETHAPERFYGASRAMGGGFMLARLYPEIFVDNPLWSDDGTLESVLARAPNVVTVGNLWLHGRAVSVESLRGLGVVALDIRAEQNDGKTRDGQLALQTHIYNETIGQPEYGKTILDRYFREFAEFRRDFPAPMEDADRPRFISMGASSKNWSRIFVIDDDADEDNFRKDIGVRNAVRGFRAVGRQQDAERVLAIDPDVILLLSGDAREFMHDPRWKGLKTVRERRVYTNNPSFNGYRHDIDHLPLSYRWLAEIVHPDRLVPRVRESLREHYREAYQYSLSDDEIDELLSVEQNSESAGYTRFMRQQGQRTSP